ncbi:hypothetical protein BV911_18770 [Pseudoruegeria sp. SK021]|nr:hypothetical protein BV911_18770 [Pseudoruegeria sp. SK021]
MSHAVDRGIALAARHGIVSNTSFMVAAAYPSIGDAAQRVSDIDVPCGIHLQLTSGAPLTPELARTWGNAFPDLARARSIAPALAKAEWRAQIDAALEARLTPSHLDSHQGLHRLAAFRTIYFDLAREYGLPARGYDAEFAQNAKDLGVSTPDHTLSEWTGGFHSWHSLSESLGTLNAVIPDLAVCELVTHPGFIDSQLMASSRWTQCRLHDLLELVRPQLQDFLLAEDIKLVNFASLAPRRPSTPSSE